VSALVLLQVTSRTTRELLLNTTTTTTMKMSQLLTEQLSEADNLDYLSHRDAEGEIDDEMEDQTTIQRQLPFPEPETTADAFKGPPSYHEAHGEATAS
jgi:hypothetical protein